ncbi:phosphocholine-specific phospholipase C [Novosphingobium beihaiensis]|uniref:phospholipase C n=1 Tax=Novosphingobium beihaiensis TaxID=2930389 RepID=A0ABT0BTT4_9SPHN|nr:phospholipase C, phosphocholine-specific [Novosphingobium beihaiensis]MCJ2188465.1 phospholipase C, phosphocholine-specific [Novosphingobium beihaiensis]
MIDRRLFMQRLASLAAAGAVPAPIAKALAQPANRRTGTLHDVEHVVILMQENRSFDHYFGTLPGVRGFADPRPLRLGPGKTVFHQPDPAGGEVLPFRMNAKTTSGQLLKSLDHSWKGDAAEWAGYDVWIKHKTAMTMGYFTREDVPFYHALADAFTVCDAYYCSLHGPTNPNRMYLFTGTSGMAVGDMRRHAVHNEDDGNWTGDASLDKPDWAGAARWTTYAERLGKAGVDWKVYQEFDNFGCNSLAYFEQFRGLDPASGLYRRGRAMVPGSTKENAAETTGQYLVDALKADVQADRLPQVSWIVTPTKFCEHPEAPPAFGEDMTSRVLDALVSNPEVWAKTALIINYDENDGFFDHMPGPIPATAPAMGLSTADTRGEVYDGQSVGLGIRVPLLAISPWSRGGWVNSQVHDHTSVIRFLERRFGVMEPNITPWRRAVTGDLTSLFDFSDPDGSALHALPATDDYLARIMAVAALPLPEVPAAQAVPRQEPGRRPARPLPYRLNVSARRGDAGLELTFANGGMAGVVYQVYAHGSGAPGPWSYTLEPGKEVSDVLPGLPLDGAYDLSVHGPNGWLRELAGDAGKESLRTPVIVLDESDPDILRLSIVNMSGSAETFAITAPVYGEIEPVSLTLASGEQRSLTIPVAANDHWYDLHVAQEGAALRRRFAGHAETGRASRSDPALEMA